jgi:hypothetical protein
MGTRIGLGLCLLLLQCDGPTPGTGATTTTRVRVVVVPEPGAPAREATLECGQRPRSTGFITDAAAACAAVTANRRFLLEGPPADRQCTMIYGGPQVATVTGEIDGKAVRREVRRSDGCGISDWRSLEALLGKP